MTRSEPEPGNRFETVDSPEKLLHPILWVAVIGHDICLVGLDGIHIYFS